MPDIKDPVVVKVLWAAMCAMVLDIHSPQDNLTTKDWRVAKSTFHKLDYLVNQ